MIEKIREILKRLLKINLEINSLFLSLQNNSEKNEKEFLNFNKKLEELLDIKNALIKGLEYFKEINKQEFLNLKETEFKEIWEKLTKLEEENLTMLNDCQSLLSIEMSNIKNHSKAISSYKFNKEIKPRLFDDLG